MIGSSGVNEERRVVLTVSAFETEALTMAVPEVSKIVEGAPVGVADQVLKRTKRSAVFLR